MKVESTKLMREISQNPKALKQLQAALVNPALTVYLEGKTFQAGDTKLWLTDSYVKNVYKLFITTSLGVKSQTVQHMERLAGVENG